MQNTTKGDFELNPFDDIVYATHSRPSDVSMNLDDQRVVILGKNGNPSVRKYTVYRVRWRGDTIIGNVRRKNDPNQPNPEYEFNPQERHWTQTEASRKRDRDAKAKDVPPAELRQRYARGERLNRAELDRLYDAYPELEKVHRPPSATKEQRIHRAEQRRKNWKDLKRKSENSNL